MRHTISVWGMLLFVSIVTLVSCTKQELVSPEEGTPLKSFSKTTNICGNYSTADIIKPAQNQNQSDVHLGYIYVSNDKNNIYIEIQTPNRTFEGSKVYEGNCNSVPTNGSGYDATMNHNPLVSNYEYTFPNNYNAGDIICIAARVEGISNGGGTRYISLNYVIQECPCEILPGNFKTYGQGAYSSPSNSTPGAYLDANFATVFPGGLVIGCESGSELSLTSATAVRAFLPQGSSPKVLDQNYTDPADKITVLAGQVATLALNIGFDDHDASFSPSSVAFKSLKIASGDFEGMTVEAILGLANDVLGGCNNTHSPSQMNEVVTAINENFEDGLIDNGFLICQ